MLSNAQQIDAPQRLLANRSFVLLWCAYGISAMGDHLSEIAILKTQDALSPDIDVTPIAARLTFALFLPFLLFAPIAGALADRFSRRMLMIVADVARCLIFLGFVSLLVWAKPLGRWGPAGPLFLVGIFTALFSPARSALLPSLIRPNQLIRANGMISGLGIIATMGALLAGGLLASHFDAVIAFRLDAATFLLSAILVYSIRAPARSHRPPSAGPRAAMRDLRRGFAYAREHALVRGLLAAAAVVWLCGALVYSAIPAVVRDVYQGQYMAFSEYRAFVGLGFIFGAAIIVGFGEAIRSEIVIPYGLWGIGCGVAILALSVFLPVGAAAAGAIGAVGIILASMSAACTMAAFNALLQWLVPDRYLGRIFGVKDVCTIAALLLATGLLGIPHWESVDRAVGFILLAAALLALLAGYVGLRERIARLPGGVFYDLLDHVNRFLATWWWRMRVVGRPTVPNQGPVILVANHTCYSDPLLILAAVRNRSFGFMVADEYMQKQPLRFLMRTAHCLPVKRDGMDAKATRQAMRRLRNGEVIGIFVEGRIVRPGQQRDLKDGVAMLALRTGAKVIPIHISGTIYRKEVLPGLLVRHHARVRFGPPVDLSDYSGKTRDRTELRAATQKIFDTIQDLARTDQQPQDSTTELRSC